MTCTPPGYAIGYLEHVDVVPDVIGYLERIEATFESYGGQWLVHATPHVTHEGSAPGGIIIIRFPSVAASREWFDSQPYQDIAPLRIEHADSTIVTVEGVPDGYRATTTAATMRAGLAAD